MEKNKTLAMSVYVNENSGLSPANQRNGVYYARNIFALLRMFKLAVSEITKNLQDKELDTSMHFSLGKPDFKTYGRYMRYWYYCTPCLYQDVTLYVENGKIVRLYTAIEMPIKKFNTINKLIEKFNQD